MKKLVYIIVSMASVLVSLSACSIYGRYHRPDQLPVDSLYRYDTVSTADTVTLGDYSWEDLFQDSLLQRLITYGLEHNTDMQVALLRVDQAKSQLQAARLSFLPSLTLSPEGSISKSNGTSVKTYDLAVQASWEIDLFGNLRNAKQAAKSALLEQQAYQLAVRSNLIASIANSYYSLLALDEQVAISAATLEVWREQVRTMQARFKVGEETESAVTQAQASCFELEAAYVDLLRQQREVENALCTLLGMTSQSIPRTTLAEQQPVECVATGVPLRLLSKRPDVVQAEMTLAGAYYTVLQARSAFYPNLTLTGSAGWTNALGEVVTNPGGWLLSAIGSLTQPIFNRGTLVSNLRVSKDEEQIALLNYRQTLLNAGEEVNNALFALETAGKSLENHESQCRQLERAVRVTESLYKTGNATYLECLTARQSLLNARLNVVTDQLTYLQGTVSLYNALGGGTD